MATRREIFAQPIPQNPPLDGPVLLKDGRPAYLRRASADDLPALVSFLQRVSDHSMAYRFFGNIPRGPQVAERLIAPEVQGTGLSLVVTVGEGERAKIVGVGSYERIGDHPVAEVAFLVEDQFQGRGIGMLLLERLAMGAEGEGLERLEAVVMPENQRMLRIFTDSGYEIDREFEGGDILISFSIEPTRTSVERYEARDRVATVASLIPFFHPRSVAVIGASRDPDQIGHRVVYNLVRSRFHGPVYPVNPRAEVIASMPAYPSVLAVPHDIDGYRRRAARRGAGRGRRVRRKGNPGPDRVDRGFRRVRSRGKGTAGAARDEGTCERHAPHRAQLPGAYQYRRRSALARHLRRRVAPAGTRGDVVSERRAGPGRARVRERFGPRLFVLRRHRKQGGRLGQ